MTADTCNANDEIFLDSNSVYILLMENDEDICKYGIKEGSTCGLDGTECNETKCCHTVESYRENMNETPIINTTTNPEKEFISYIPSLCKADITDGYKDIIQNINAENLTYTDFRNKYFLKDLKTIDNNVGMKFSCDIGYHNYNPALLSSDSIYLETDGQFPDNVYTDINANCSEKFSKLTLNQTDHNQFNVSGCTQCIPINNCQNSGNFQDETAECLNLICSAFDNNEERCQQLSTCEWTEDKCYTKKEYINKLKSTFYWILYK